MCASLREEIQPHAFHPKVHECINTELCVLCSRQSSGLQLACSTLAHLHIETQNLFVCVCVFECVCVDVCDCVCVCVSVCMCVCVCVALCVKEGSQVAAPDLLTQLHS